MPQLFTVRWPLLARLEAILLFPVAVRLAGELAPVQHVIARNVMPFLAPLALATGLPNSAMAPCALVVAVMVPYLVWLVAADRILTLRRGFVLLSVIAIIGWGTAAAQISDQFSTLFSGGMGNAGRGLAFSQKLVLAVGAIAFLAHLWPLWIGLRDRGDIADRLIAARENAAARRNPRRAQDMYSWETSGFHDWRPQEQDGPRGPGENGALKIVWAIIWLGLFVGGTAIYLNRDKLPAIRYAAGTAGYGSDVPVKPILPVSRADEALASPLPRRAAPPLTPASDPPAVVAIPPSPPAAVAAPGRPAVLKPTSTPTVSAAALPSVQRPSETSSSVRSGIGLAAPNEAVSERGNDGSFVFDAVVNGGHVPMLFDTGASVVALRAEDAARLGISMTRLNYSAKVKTANGTAEVAPIVIETLTVGNITQHDVVGFVAKQGVLHENLLGQAFLARLAGYNVERNVLILHGH